MHRSASINPRPAPWALLMKTVCRSHAKRLNPHPQGRNATPFLCTASITSCCCARKALPSWLVQFMSEAIMSSTDGNGSNACTRDPTATGPLKWPGRVRRRSDNGVGPPISQLQESDQKKLPLPGLAPAADPDTTRFAKPTGLVQLGETTMALAQTRELSKPSDCQHQSEPFERPVQKSHRSLL
jgi:hypothetical protein